MAAHSGKDLKGTSVLTGSERKTLDELQRDLEDQRELAQNRMVELDTLNSNYKECLQQVGFGEIVREVIIMSLLDERWRN